jgi:hypothetical protein
VLGILVIVLGLAAAGVLADAAVENAASGPRHAVDVFGQTVHLSTPQLAVAGAILGAVAVLLIGVGLVLLGRRRARRRGHAPDQRELERRVEQLAARSRLLESQNAALTQENSALRLRAEELETEAAPVPSEEFGPAAGQVSKTALISPPPAPASPVGGQATDRPQ